MVTTIAGKTTFDEYGNPTRWLCGWHREPRDLINLWAWRWTHHTTSMWRHTYNHAIRKVSPVGTNWVVMTLAGLAGVYLPYGADGMVTPLGFIFLGCRSGQRWQHFCMNFRNNTIRKNSTGPGTNWIVTNARGLAGVSGTNDDTGSAARFNGPFGVAVDSADNVIVGDLLNHTIRKVTPIGTNWMVTTARRTGEAFRARMTEMRAGLGFLSQRRVVGQHG